MQEVSQKEDLDQQNDSWNSQIAGSGQNEFYKEANQSSPDWPDIEIIEKCIYAHFDF